MGVVFLEHPGGKRLFSCTICDACLTNGDELISTDFTCVTGPGYLFNKAVNLKKGNAVKRQMVTGDYMVRDVYCKRCDTKLGWTYEFAFEESQKEKEGKVLLEEVLITESEGFDDPVLPYIFNNN